MFEWIRNSYFIKNELARYIFLTVWFIGNIAAFIGTFLYYHSSLEYFYLRKLVQNGVSISRASATCLNINCLLILLPVCRNLISYTRNFWCCNISIKRGIIDKNLTFHRYIGYSIIFFSILHTLGHIHNFEMLASAYNLNGDGVEAGLLSTLSYLPVLRNGTYINPIREENAVVVLEAFKFVSGITGVLMCIALCFIAATSSEYMRRSYFNLFWYVHNVAALLFFICFVTHGLQGIIRKQTNLQQNNPEKCYLVYYDWSKQNKNCDIPEFAGSNPSSWIWVIIPIVIYLIERLFRFFRGLKNYYIVGYTVHPSNVLELKIDNRFNSKPIIKHSAGQYVYLNHAKISYLEWHPFTLTSAPDDPFLSVHIRCAGDWTQKLLKSLTNDNKGYNEIKEENSELLKIHIDGPYGSCAEDIFSYETVVLIGAGIGATPYASILKHISNIVNSSAINRLSKFKRIYFFWICPSIDTFEWFGSLLQSVEADINLVNRGLLELKIYLTKGWSLKEAKQIAVNERESRDLFTGLEQKTNYGRPNFDLFFKEISSADRDLDASSNSETVIIQTEKVGVFFCGPSELSKELHKICNKYSNTRWRFIYNKESF